MINLILITILTILVRYGLVSRSQGNSEYELGKYNTPGMYSFQHDYSSINIGSQTLWYIQVTLGPSSGSTFVRKASTFRTSFSQSTPSVKFPTLYVILINFVC